MMTVEAVQQIILQNSIRTGTERVSIIDSRGRVLAEPIIADISNPPFDNSAVDGYAVHASDTIGASTGRPVVLTLAASVRAGDAPPDQLSTKTACKVMTGAPLPKGADAVVMREDATEIDGCVHISCPASVGDHFRSAGEDFTCGSELLKPGAAIGFAEIAIMAAVGRSFVDCSRRPRVAVFSTGDELIDIDQFPGPGQLRDSNRLTMAAMAEACGCEIVNSSRLPDDLEATIKSFRVAATEDCVDCIITSGGVSVGDHDFVKPALEHLGTLDLWRVNMKPGKPLAYGRIGNTAFMGLPGNPVSTMVTFELFVRPLFWKMQGRLDLLRPMFSVALQEAIHHNTGRREYVRGRYWNSSGQWLAAATGGQGSGMLTSMPGVNCLLILQDDRGHYEAGETVEALALNAPSQGE